MQLSEYVGTEARHILVYGPPKTGKTELVGRLAKNFKLWWFDLDGGAKTLMSPLSGAYPYINNIVYFRIPDTQQFPIATETMLKVFKGGKMSVCHKHGKVECPACKKDGLPSTEICLDTFDNKKDILVLDSYTQLMDSVTNWIHKDALAKDDWNNIKSSYDDYAKQGSISDRFGSVIQNASFNTIVISHEILSELEDGTKVETKEGVIARIEEKEAPEIEVELQDVEVEGPKGSEAEVSVPDPMDEFMALVKDMMEKISEKMKSMEEKVEEVKADFDQFKKEPAGKKISDGKTDFNKQASSDDVIAERLAAIAAMRKK